MEHSLFPIFSNITKMQYEDMVACGCVRKKAYPKGTTIFRIGDQTQEFGVLTMGEIHIESLDLWGNRMILHQISPGESFAETYAFCYVPMMVNVIAAQDCQVLLIHLGVLLSPCNHSKPWYQTLIFNLLTLSASKNLLWSRRIFCITSKHIRTRVMTYLSLEAVKCDCQSFSIPFNRQQMADYLNVERSALSKELGRMQKEGILDYHKNHFSLRQIISY